MAKNSVEEYVYSIRDKLYGKLEKFMKEQEKEAYMAELTKTEDWLYDEGENCQKQVGTRNIRIIYSNATYYNFV